MKRKLKMILTVSSVGNPDHGQYYGRNVLSPTQRIQVNDFMEASRICRAYIAQYDLGGGNWTGGVIRQGQRIIARVSYNGRVWLVGGRKSERRPIYDPEESTQQ